MQKTYHGSCHCGAVRYQASLDLAEGTGRCNCTYCSKIRNWSARATDFELLAGEAALGDYGKDWGEGNLHHRFCTRCGVTVYGHGHIPEAGGDYLAIHVNTLDDASIDELLSGEVRYMDGRHDNWMNPPADIRAL
ncbi:MAG TPA: GFA family protein [Pseudoxanthomonas sp.]|uniref:GFA family protein n=1 Tax=Pseudoxanthomonas helianthi TaxID=1453541 RepID=A0A940XAQ6_9GAMM|nr:GFA family protein [Pseudoxanthomonas helianthi]MBP3985894.1 GFA family protein [Pseudoxanthomonas helianthi]HWU70199.1 GFA family protein [Pseudoxanthomonas sp.]